MRSAATARIPQGRAKKVCEDLKTARREEGAKSTLSREENRGGQVKRREKKRKAEEDTRF